MLQLHICIFLILSIEALAFSTTRNHYIEHSQRFKNNNNILIEETTTFRHGRELLSFSKNDHNDHIIMNMGSNMNDLNLPAMKHRSHPNNNLFSSFKLLFLGVSIFMSVMTQQPNISHAESATTTTTTTTTEPIATTSISNENISTTTSNKKSKYWDLVNSQDLEMVQTANERLMDYVVGTINTMYYDNSGGFNFSPKDMYDRWKVMRIYAKEGTDGVKKAIPVSNVVNTDSFQSYDDDNSNNVDEFLPQLFFVQDNTVKVQMQHLKSSIIATNEKLTVPSHAFDSRENVVESLKWLVGTLDDTYSKYLTREELQRELQVRDYSFLGLGAIVEGPKGKGKDIGESYSNSIRNSNSNNPNRKSVKSRNENESNSFLTFRSVSNLPLVTAIAPDSPAERAGIVVGDRIAAVGEDNFVGLKKEEVTKKFDTVYTGAENYFGRPELTIAKPILRTVNFQVKVDENEEDYTRDENEDRSFRRSTGTTSTSSDDQNMDREELIGYKLSRVRIPTSFLQPYQPRMSNSQGSQGSATLAQASFNNMNMIHPVSAALEPTATSTSTAPFISGGDAIVHWELLTSNDSIFRKYLSIDQNVQFKSSDRVGYIRLTRFSRSSTAGYIKAIEELENAGAQSYIIDVRNNYGGVIQESMLTAASLLRDPHTVLCYTLNSRGGFTPHDTEEYIVDTRYPGYLLSSESKDVTFEQVKRENPEFVSGDGWVPPSSYASIHEQRMKRNIHRPSFNPFGRSVNVSMQRNAAAKEMRQLQAQKKLVILMNEGTASAAEVFASSLHDNGRTVATVGTKTYGKGLIQHTFPLQDGGGLRLTVAEYLTPALQHVTKVGNAQYDGFTGQYVGGGIVPDIYCPSSQGIPSNIGADICVGMALDALEDADAKEMEMATSTRPFNDDSQPVAGRRGGIDGGSRRRKLPTQGLAWDGF